MSAVLFWSLYAPAWASLIALYGFGVVRPALRADQQ